MRNNSAIIDPIAALFLNEYIKRTRLKELGYTDSIENLDVITAEAFLIISVEIDKIRNEDAKKRNSR